MGRGRKRRTSLELCRTKTSLGKKQGIRVKDEVSRVSRHAKRGHIHKCAKLTSKVGEAFKIDDLRRRKNVRSKPKGEKEPLK